MKLSTLIHSSLKISACACVGAACLLSAVPAHSADAPPKKLKVVTSFLPIQSHTAAIAGDRAEVKQLLDKDAGPHDFQLTPAAVRLLAEADLFIINGVGMEEWLDDLLAKADNKKLIVVDTSADVSLLANSEEIETPGDHEHQHESGHGHKHEHGDSHDHSGHGHCEHHSSDKNPHIWLDPVIARQQAAAILAALQKADTTNAKAYQANAKAYFAELDKLHRDFQSALASLPNKKLVTFHDAFPYLAARYGLEQVGYVSEFPERDPNPRQLAALVDKIKELKVGVLFSESGYAPGLLKKIAAQTGAKVSSLDTLEVGEGTPTAYIERMRQNLASLQEAFSADSP